ncbi:4359_t:CDS:10 [Entrophospora sp. SA101]|nr:4359_t:CDS:10 [Entrophospora sp. SA101]
MEILEVISQHIWNSKFSSPVSETLNNGGASVIDIGCGPGTWLMYMAKEFPKSSFVGIDIATDSKKESPANMAIISHNILDGLPFPDDTFDFVHQKHMTNSLKIDQWPFIIDELIRITKPGVKKIYKSRGIDESVCESIRKKLISTNKIIEISHQSKKFPLGDHGMASEMFRENLFGSMETIRPDISSVIGISLEECDEMFRQLPLESYTSYTPLLEENNEIQATSPKISTSDDDIDYDSLSHNTSLNYHFHQHFDEPVLRNFEKTAKITPFVVISALIVTIGRFLFGFDTGVISAAMLLIEHEFIMTAFQKGMVVGATTIGAFFGGLGAGSLSDFSGRRITSTLAAIVFLVGSLIITFADTYYYLVIGRFVIGLAIGIASMVVPIYVSEISPRFHRGHLVTMNILLIISGQVIAYLVGVLFVSNGGWRWMFGVSIIPPIIQLICMPFVPESPRYLVKSDELGEAMNVLHKIYPKAPQNFLDEEIKIIQKTIEQDSTGSYQQLLHHPNLRPLGTILKMAGFAIIKEAIVFSILVSITNFVTTVVALYVIDRVGRRTILLYTIIATVIGLFLLGIGFVSIVGLVPKQDTCIDYGTRCAACVIDDRCGFSKHSGGICSPKNDHKEFYDSCPDGSLAGSLFTLFTLMLFISGEFAFCYALGLGHAPWLMQSELFPLNIRGRASGVATATNWFMNSCVVIAFLPLTETITISGTFWLYALLMTFGWFFVYFMVPETSGRSLEEITEDFL